MYTPQEALVDFKSGKFSEKNRTFLEPIYKALFEELGKPLDINNKLNQSVEVVFSFFKRVNSFKKYTNSSKSEIDFGLTFAEIDKKISSKEICLVVESILHIIKFIESERTNINGLEALLWTLFNETSREGLLAEYLNQPDKIANKLLGREFLTLAIRYPAFICISFKNILMPIELKNPNRRMGGFDVMVVESII